MTWTFRIERAVEGYIVASDQSYYSVHVMINGVYATQAEALAASLKRLNAIHIEVLRGYRATQKRLRNIQANERRTKRQLTAQIKTA